jgi:hypothetical protein
MGHMRAVQNVTAPYRTVSASQNRNLALLCVVGAIKRTIGPS